jgi:hypothetical protein
LFLLFYWCCFVCTDLFQLFYWCCFVCTDLFQLFYWCCFVCTDCYLCVHVGLLSNVLFGDQPLTHDLPYKSVQTKQHQYNSWNKTVQTKQHQ